MASTFRRVIKTIGSSVTLAGHLAMERLSAFVGVTPHGLMGHYLGGCCRHWVLIRLEIRKTVEGLLQDRESGKRYI